jgi:hypothetical protein
VREGVYPRTHDCFMFMSLLSGWHMCWCAPMPPASSVSNLHWLEHQLIQGKALRIGVAVHVAPACLPAAILLTGHLIC